MIITFVLPGWSILKPIGGFKVVYEYANRLVDRGHVVNVIHPLLLSPGEARLKQQMKKYIMKVAKLTFRKNKVKWFAVSPRVNVLVVPTLREDSIPDGDVIIATAWRTAEYVAEYSLSKGQKSYLVMDFYPWLGPKDRLEATWRAPFRKIAISSWLYEKVHQATLRKNNLTVIPLGVDQRRYRLTQDLNSRENMVSMMYSLGSYKAPQDGIRALEICRAHRPDLNAVLFGPASPRRAIPSWMVFRKNISEEQQVRIFNQSKIFLCSSLAEGFAFPPAEAMACGCAVVSTDCGGIREYAVHEVNALLSPPGDPQTLAENIIRLLEEDDLRVRLAKTGHQQIHEFTWDEAVTRLEEVLKQK